MTWINVRERLPEKSGLYPAVAVAPDRHDPEDWADALCYYDKKAGKGNIKWQHSSGFYDGGITHWMEVPKLPRGES